MDEGIVEDIFLNTGKWKMIIIIIMAVMTMI
jgi:hypothetical protein